MPGQDGILRQHPDLRAGGDQQQHQLPAQDDPGPAAHPRMLSSDILYP